MPLRLLSPFLTVLILVAATTMNAYGSTISYVEACNSGSCYRATTPNGACLLLANSMGATGGGQSPSGTQCRATFGGTTTMNFGSVQAYNNVDCPHGNTGLYCNSPPVCEGGSSWDFDSQSCKYPQDDACGAIGASWDPVSSSCECDSPTDALVTAAGVTRCMTMRDDSCNKDSPDFKGYVTSGSGAGQAVCDGRASCPDGGTPGYVGVGDTMTAICYNNSPPTDDCDGQTGVVNGVQVCIPDPGKDPEFPDCSGVVGLVNGVKTCIHKPTEHPGCKPGETAGYVGTGANAQFTCVPADYKPETCPPGQYTTLESTGGFGCATASGQSKDDVEAGKTPGKVEGTSETIKKDAEGNVVGTEESTINLDLTQLTEDAPANNFKEELDEFSESQLDGLGLSEIAGEFSGTSGVFTERSSLDSASNFFIQHTIGSGANCSGNFPFFGYLINCEKFSHFNRIFGWFFFIWALWYIYETLTAPSPS